MRRFLIHLAVALVAFTVGVAAAALFGVAGGPRAKRECNKAVYVAPPPPQSFKKSCPNGLRFDLPPPPPAHPAMQAAPEQSGEKHVRVRRTVRKEDGTVEVIELRTEKPVEKKF